MKNFKKMIVIGLATGLIIGCASSTNKQRNAETNEDQEKEMIENVDKVYMSDTMATNSEKNMSSSAAKANKDTNRKFIREADIKFKVKDVRNSTYAIEDIVSTYDGFVTYTNLTSSVDRTLIIPISADSSLECIYYTVQNEMIIRVPNTKLDTTLKSIAKLVDFLDYRLLKADDVGLSLLINKLAEKRLKTHQERLKYAIDNRGKKLNETSNAEDDLLNKQELSDNAMVSNLSLNDRISYSTVKLNLYQRQSVKKELIGNGKNIDSYRPGFLIQIKESIQSGWKIVEVILLFIIQAWSVITLGLIVWFVYRKYFRVKK